MNQVNCKYCGTLTNMTATKLCDRCWELERLINYCKPEVLVKIMDANGWNITAKE